MQHAQRLDLRGLGCAEPIVRLAAALKSMQSGAVLLAESDRAAMRKDVPAFCARTRHELIQAMEDGPLLRFWIRRKR
jgi:tRNA 2-thiouridine synthesizing protein A